MRFLVIGRGWTGKKVFNELLSRNHVVTFCNHKDGLVEAAEGNYDWVVNCAGMTGTPNVDACELQREETNEANAVFPIRLFHACEDNYYNPRLAHFSSGCIYQGEVNDIFEDPNYFGSIYSVTKGISDLYLKNRALVFRIRMPFTGVDESKNYLSKIVNYAKTGKLVDFGENSLTDLDEAVTTACDLMMDDGIGPYNLVNQGTVNMHELAEMLGLENVQWYTHEEFKAVTLAARSTCSLNAHHTMRPVREALEAAIAKLKCKIT